jgi:hypothetical protein
MLSVYKQGVATPCLINSCNIFEVLPLKNKILSFIIRTLRQREIMKIQQQITLNNWWSLHLSAGEFCWRKF